MRMAGNIAGNCIARPNGRARIETLNKVCLHTHGPASPGRMGGRGLKRTDGSTTAGEPSASPGRMVGRGLKQYLDWRKPAFRGCIARPNGRARIETFQEPDT